MDMMTSLAIETSSDTEFVSDRGQRQQGSTGNPSLTTSWVTARLGADQAAPLMSADTMVAVEIVVQVGFLPAIVLCGIAMNIINVAVFYRQGVSDRIHLCLLCLAVCDLGYMLFLMVTRLFSVLHLISESLGEYWKAEGFSLVGVYASFLNTSNCLTLLIALERCMCVVWPLKAKEIISLRKIRCLIGLAFVFCFASNMLFCFKFNTVSYQDSITNNTRYRVGPTEFYVENRAVVDLVFETFNFVVPTVSFLVVMIATIIIKVRMRSVLAWRKGTVKRGATGSVKESRESSMTRMLAVVCVIYTLCTIPYVTHALFRFFMPAFRPEGRYRNIMYATVAIVHLFLCINSSANFVVYLTMSSRFKATLKTMLRMKQTGPQEKSNPRCSSVSDRMSGAGTGQETK